jgi:recombination protein RecA
MGRPKKKVEGAEKSAPSSLGVDDIISHLQKHGSGYTTRMTDEKSVITIPKFLSTGLPNIDHMLGGGIPAGRITELFSKGEGVGKSSFAAHIIAEMQRQGGKVILMDTEHGLTEERMRTLGVDPEEIIYDQPDHIQGACANISQVIRLMKEANDEKGLLIVWDSVTGTSSKGEFEASYEDILIASGARAWSASLRKLKDELARSEIYCIMVAQTRTNIGQMYGDKQQSTGGMGLKYYSGQRIVMTRGAGAWLKNGPQKVGFKVTMETEKSRLAAPYQKAVASLIFTKGYDRWKSLFDLLLKLEVLIQNGAWYELDGVEKSFQMKDFKKVIEALDTTQKEALTTLLLSASVNVETVKYFF